MPVKTAVSNEIACQVTMRKAKFILLAALVGLIVVCAVIFAAAPPGL
jgi:hypothetical protein